MIRRHKRPTSRACLRGIAVMTLFVASVYAREAIAASGETMTKAVSACSPGESWRFGSALPKDIKRDFERFNAPGASLAKSFTKALSARKRASTEEARVFTELWLAKTLYRMELYHAAQSGLSAIASYPTGEKLVGMQVAAVECLNRLQDKAPSLAFPMPVLGSLKTYPSSLRKERDMHVLWEFATNAVVHQISEGEPEADIRRSMAALRGSGPYESLASGFLAAHLGKEKLVIEDVERFFKELSPTQASYGVLKSRVPQAKLLVARSYFELKQYDKAMAHFRGVDKGSNELASALSELSWSALMSGKYSDAIGAALSSNAGGLRKTFSPEAPMVMAMAMNELCQFPESLRAVDLFRKNYQTSYDWLSRSQGKALYPEAISFLARKDSGVPVRVGSEWMRSPVFIASQQELNLLADERDGIVRVSTEGAKEMRELSSEIQHKAIKLQKRVADERGRQKVYMTGLKTLSPNLRADIGKFAGEVSDYREMRAAGAAWRSIAKKHQAKMASTKEKLVSRINLDLAKRNSRMLNQLMEIAENNRMIEIEIYNGATQDIIWQNNNPGYNEVAEKLKEDHVKLASAEVWNWGHSPTDSENWQEVWEDELGSFKVDLYDNCSSKDKYLAIKGLMKNKKQT